MGNKVWNFRRVQRINSYFNGLAMAGILLVLASIPITFFSLRASVEDELTTIVFTNHETGFFNFTIFFPVHESKDQPEGIRLDFDELALLVYDHGPGFVTEAVKEYRLPPPSRSTLAPHPIFEYISFLLQPYSILIIQKAELEYQLDLNTNAIHFRWLDENNKTCELAFQHRDPVRFDFCLVDDDFDDGFGVALVGLGGKVKKMNVLSRVIYHLSKPRFKFSNDQELGVTMDCNSNACRLAAYCNIVIDIEDTIKASICNDYSVKNDVLSTVHNASLDGLIHPLITSDNPRIFVAINRPEVDGSLVYLRPPPLVVVGTREQQKYTTLDIATDSFAISSLIATCFTLIFLLAKLVMYHYSLRLASRASDSS